MPRRARIKAEIFDRKYTIDAGSQESAHQADKDGLCRQFRQTA